MAKAASKKEVKLSFQWNIKNFSLLPHDTGKAFYSPTFAGGVHDNSTWRLRMYPRGERRRYEDYIALYLELISCTGSSVRANLKLSILNANQEEVNITEGSQGRHLKEGGSCGFFDFVKRNFLLDEANGLLPGDQLTINCEVSAVNDSIDLSERLKAAELKVPEDLGQLLQSERFSDITLVVEGKEYKAHKAILAARSPVFAAMLEHGVEEEEKKQSRVEVTDLEADVLGELLKFTYTGKSSNLVTMARDLLVAADKYSLEGLKVMCEELLAEELSVEVAVEVLVFADLHSAKLLKEWTIDFIMEHAVEVKETLEWKSMHHSHPHLIDEVFEALAMWKVPPHSEMKEKMPPPPPPTHFTTKLRRDDWGWEDDWADC